MYQAGYAEVLEDSDTLARSHERQALTRAIEMLTIAEKCGRRSREALDALMFTTRLWNILLQDLASPENALPIQLRANLISVGIWVVKEAERIRRDESDNFAGIIQVCDSIRGGLK